MAVSHVHPVTVIGADDGLPGLLEVLAGVPDPRRRRGRRYALVFMLAVAVTCVLAGARSFREIGDQAADLPQEVLARLGGAPHPLRRRIVAPSEKRIRTVLQEIDAAALDTAAGCWLRGLARAGKLSDLPAAIAIDGKWLCGIGDGRQVKLFAAMLHRDKVIIAQHAIPEGTNEITQVRAPLDPVDPEGTVITGDAAHAQRDTAAYIAGPHDDGGRAGDYFLFVKGNQPGVQRACYDAIQADCPREADHVDIDYGHGRIIKRSLWVTDAADIDFPHATRAVRIHRDSYDTSGALISEEIVHAVTSLNDDQAGPADLATIARGQWGIESVRWVRDTAYTEDAGYAGYTDNGPQVLATCRNIAISLLHLASTTQITRTLQTNGRDRNPPTQLPTAMRPASQPTLPTPCLEGHSNER